jgi:D-arabinose 1-dehydrogenase-like Zn-dependent alcohol dehydrogenase
VRVRHEAGCCQKLDLRLWQRCFGPVDGRQIAIWEERELLSVANLTRQDGIDFLGKIPAMGIVTTTTPYPLEKVNEALADLRAGRFKGAAVLVP